MISAKAVARYREDGYLVLERLLPAERLAALRRKIDAISEQARGLTESNDVFELEESHRPDAPKVQRVRLPHTLDPFFWELIRSPEIVEAATSLLGPSVRLRSSKLNMKTSGGAAVEWHQDWAFYPHTNDDVLAVGVMVDDMTAENGPLMVLPGTHKGPLYDHHHDGFFTGGIDPDRDGIDFSAAVPLLAPAGSVSLHHARLIHGSDVNRSGQSRRLLLYELTAADAWPLAGPFSGYGDWESFNAQLIAGEPCDRPRLADVPVRLPLPAATDFPSIFQLQRQGAQKHYFAPAAEAESLRP